MVAKFLDDNNREFKQRRRRRSISGRKKKNREAECDCSVAKFQVVFVHILDEFSGMMFSEGKRVVTA